MHLWALMYRSPESLPNRPTPHCPSHGSHTAHITFLPILFPTVLMVSSLGTTLLQSSRCLRITTSSALLFNSFPGCTPTPEDRDPRLHELNGGEHTLASSSESDAFVKSL